MPTAVSKRHHAQSMSEDIRTKSINALENGGLGGNNFFLVSNICFPNSGDPSPEKSE